ncbi:hypothetical protein QM312_36850, partial [Burkholderia cenocepacia]|nr:hypothetical protein [Burkholderia cenocepacia]
ADVLAAAAVGVCGGLVLAGGALLFAGRALPDGVHVDHALAMLFWAVWVGAIAPTHTAQNSIASAWSTCTPSGSARPANSRAPPASTSPPHTPTAAAASTSA